MRKKMKEEEKKEKKKVTQRGVSVVEHLLWQRYVFSSHHPCGDQ